MAGVTYVVGLPEVVHYGGAVENRDSYPADEVFAIGDLIRITSAGTVKLAEDGNGTIKGALSGIALGTGAASATDPCPVLLFAADTVISVPVSDATNPDDDYSTGVLYELDPASVTGAWALSTTTTAGVFRTVDSPATGQPWDDATGSYTVNTDTDGSATVAAGRILCTVPETVLNGIAGA
jgi:hypothetical protein